METVSVPDYRVRFLIRNGKMNIMAGTIRKIPPNNTSNTRIPRIRSRIQIEVRWYPATLAETPTNAAMMEMTVENDNAIKTLDTLIREGVIHNSRQDWSTWDHTSDWFERAKRCVEVLREPGDLNLYSEPTLPWYSTEQTVRSYNQQVAALVGKLEGLAMRFWTRSLNIPLDMGPRQPNYGFSLVDAHQIRFVLYSNYEAYGPDQDRRRVSAMSEVLVRFFIEQLPEGAYLVTSDDVPGLVAQGRTVTEATEIAQDVVRRLVESYRDHGDPLPPSLQRVFSGHGEVIAPVAVD